MLRGAYYSTHLDVIHMCTDFHISQWNRASELSKESFATPENQTFHSDLEKNDQDNFETSSDQMIKALTNFGKSVQTW